MKSEEPRRAAIRKVPWERAGLLRALVESGAVIVAPDEKRMHKLPGGVKSMVRIDMVRLLMRPDPARALVGALERFMSRGFDDHVLLANTGAPGSGRLTGALAFSLGVRQAVLSPGSGNGGLTVRMPDNLWANPASAIVVLADTLTPTENSAVEAVQAIKRTWGKLQDKPALPPVIVLAAAAYDPGRSQLALGDHGAALHYLLSVREVVHDPRLRLNAQQRKAIHKEFR